MPLGFYISAAGAHVQNKRLDVLANNIANIQTTGYKPDYAILQARYAEAIEQGYIPPGTQLAEDTAGGNMFVGTVTSYKIGALREGGKTDLAIKGDGYFQVEGRNGENFLTRAGNFIFNQEGILTTTNGERVLNSEGEEIVINPNIEYSFGEDGSIQQEGQRVAEVGIFVPDSNDDLVKVGDNFFSTQGKDVTALSPIDKKGRVATGYNEMSGASPITSMAEMIEIQRFMEANVNMMKSQDKMLGDLISKCLTA